MSGLTSLSGAPLTKGTKGELHDKQYMVATNTGDNSFGVHLRVWRFNRMLMDYVQSSSAFGVCMQITVG